MKGRFRESTQKAEARLFGKHDPPESCERSFSPRAPLDAGTVPTSAGQETSQCTLHFGLGHDFLLQWTLSHQTFSVALCG